MWKMDSACPEKDATEILSDSDLSTKVTPATLMRDIAFFFTSSFWMNVQGINTWSLF